MRGWVYVISNRSMPGLIKVGFTLKDPDLRAKELDNTGAPHPYIVEYEVMVNHPRDLEQRVHTFLTHAREAKEWFNCSLHEAIEAIRALASSDIILENIRKDLPTTTNAIKTAQEQAGTESINISPAAKPAQKNRIRSTGTYSANCTKCGQHFSCTLTRYENFARCPECFYANDTSDFQKSDFLI
jgi:hypothetical protein